MKRIGIEALLEWVYKRELPKAVPDARTFAPSISQPSYSSGFVAIDNAFGVICDFTADGPPHPDAVTVSEVVAALDDLSFAVPEGWNPVADLGLTGDEAEDAVRRGLLMASVAGEGGGRDLICDLSMVVRDYALLGKCPVWEGDVPERRVLTGPNGRTKWFRMVEVTMQALTGPMLRRVEVDGYDPKGKRPFPDAYRKIQLDPDPAHLVASRVEYELWRCALDALVAALDGRLSEHVALPTTRAIRPWESDADGAPRVLRDLCTDGQRGAGTVKILGSKGKGQRTMPSVAAGVGAGVRL